MVEASRLRIVAGVDISETGGAFKRWQAWVGLGGKEAVPNVSGTRSSLHHPSWNLATKAKYVQIIIIIY
jgi:hypothetical protein